MIVEVTTVSGQPVKARLNLGAMGKAMKIAGINDISELKGPSVLHFLHEYVKAALPELDIDLHLSPETLQDLYAEAMTSIESNVAFFLRIPGLAAIPEPPNA